MWIKYTFTVFVTTIVFAYEEFQDIRIEDEFYGARTKYDNIFKSKDGLITVKETSPRTLSLVCFGPLKFENVIKPFKTMVSFKQVAIRECDIPPTPIVQLLQKLNINVTAIEMFILTASHILPLPPGNYTEGLNIRTIWVHEEYTDPPKKYLKDNIDFLKPLTNLTTLIIWGPEVPPIPKTTRLKVISLQKNAVLKSWGNCEDLREISIYDSEPGSVPNDWPKNCGRLTSIRLKAAAYGTVQALETSGIDSGCANLRSVSMIYCNLDILPSKILETATKLDRLILSGNHLADNSLLHFPRLENLTVLDLSKNQLTGWILFDLVQQVPSLRHLNLDGNNFLNLFCNYETRISSFASYLPKLEELSLNKMAIHPDCFERAHFTNLQKLNLFSSEEIKQMTIKKLPKTNATHLEVDLRGHLIKTVLYGNSRETWRNRIFNYEIDNGIRKTKITLLMSKIDCDCQNYWFALAVRQKRDLVSVPGLKCQKSGRNFTEEPIQSMDCKIDKEEFCVYKTLKVHSQPYIPLFNIRNVTLECHNYKEIKFGYYKYRQTEIVRLNITDNEITSLEHIGFPKTLQWVDLRRNSLSRLNSNETNKLFAHPHTRIWLSRNLFVCDCDNKPMLDAFHEHHHQIVDFNELICIESGIPLSSVTSYEVCQDQLRIALSVGGSLGALTLVTLLLLWRYRLPLKIYLYSRGMCLFCIREEEIDSDKPFDAFLSFAQGDIDYVTQKLLPKLEHEPNVYNLCVHYRDWVVGDWIPAQIMRSVSLSKRTIILLSRNFVASMWASLEFRYALASATKEGRTRLIVIVLDDVLSEPLEGELHTYVTYNTYLSCDDPFFWDKLRYAMPHRKHSPKYQVTTGVSHENIEM
ncbi:protein toll-like isoform X2 [Pectinophora gossypiella]|uniref:protein toll-like isoform X2 n=1 Tax=Pectinophora gossypiella TaxID=13191 RepID=UPI00214F01BC|nr:protein toll-like isoform X2 [Pectinophora gossypiella]